MPNIGPPIQIHSRFGTRQPQQQQEEDPLEKYLALYQLFSPERSIASARELQNVNEHKQSDEAAMEHGYPNLATMGVEERAQQHDIVNQLRAHQIQDREGEGYLKGANAATLFGKPDIAHQLLSKYLEHLGIDTGAVAPDPKQAALNAWKSRQTQGQ